MDFLIALTVAIAIYYISYKVLFEDRNEWLAYAKHELKWVPISLVLDYDVSSTRFWFWLVGDFFLGGATYFVLSHY